MSTPRLSLCMIVRDERENLTQCLESVARHVDEIIIADTGSIDGTQDVARSFGARVVEFNAHTHPQSFFVDDEKTCSAFAAPPPYSNDTALGDFGAARNESFRHATGDYILWVDADDQLEGGEHLKNAVLHMSANNIDMAFLPYDYAIDPVTGQVFYRQWRERIVKRGCSTWVNPVHEVMLPSRAVTTGKYGDVVLKHRRKADRKSIPNRNYKILLRQVAQLAAGLPSGAVLDGQIDPRTLFYLGQEARFIEPERAFGFYGEYLKRSGWPEERAAAHCALGQLYEFGVGANGADPATIWQRALREYAAANLEMPGNPDGVFGAARVYYLQGRWQDCVNACERGFAMGNPESMLGANPLDRTYRPHVYYNHALANLGRIEDAIASCKAGLAVAPDDPGVPGGSAGMLKFNLKVYEDKLAEQKQASMPPGARNLVNLSSNEDVEAPPQPHIPNGALVIWALQLWKQAVAVNDEKRARALLESLGPELAREPTIARMREVTERRWGKYVPDYARPMRETILERAMRVQFSGTSQDLAEMMRRDNARGSIVFWLGPSIEPWDPETPNRTGIGGSETACIEMAKELRRRGHDVTVYATADGEWDGVRYIDWQKCSGIDCDVLIVSRAPSVMEHSSSVRAKLKLLWVHDIHCGPATPQMERWLYCFDRVLCLSEWHRGFFLSCYPTLDPAKVLVTRNGIDPERFAPHGIDPERFAPQLGMKSNRLHWSSSPNRGLDVLLMLFPEIRKRVPDAELHIHYGFECWEAFARMHNNQAELATIDEYKRRINAAVREGGVFFHGRVNQRALAESFMRSKAWAYPTSFTETSCITAMEAQAAGCVPVCTPLAALSETVKHGVFVERGDSERFVNEVVKLLTDERARLSLAEPGRKYALENLSWRSLAGEWEGMFRKIAEECAASPVPLYREVA